MPRNLVVVVAEATTVVVVAAVGALVVVGATVVVAPLTVVLVVVAPLAVVVVAPLTVVEVAPAAALAESAPAEMWKVTWAGFELGRMSAAESGTLSGAVPGTVKAMRVASTSLPKPVSALLHTADTCMEPSACTAGLTIWKRLARLACAPPKAVLVVFRATTRPGNAGLWPGFTAAAGDGRAPPRRNWADNALGSLAVKTRATTMPRPPLPCTDPFSGRITRASTGVAGSVELVVGWKSRDVGEDEELFPPELQAARRTAARAARTRPRRIRGVMAPSFARSGC